MQSEALLLKDVSVGYADKIVVRDINLSVQAGEVFGLMGLNGAGKTTIIKSVLGLLDQSGGDIKIFGLDKNNPARRNKLSYLPEKFEPPWFLTGLEFLKFSLSFYGNIFCEQSVLDVADKLALDRSVLKKKVHSYSKGMKQKLGLMGTMMTSASLFILDEPMSGLDPLARSRVKNMILDSKRHDCAIFLSSHILADMDEICDRVALLHDGAIRFIGTPKELKEKTKETSLEKAFLDFIDQKDVA